MTIDYSHEPSPAAAGRTMSLAEYGECRWTAAMRGLEPLTMCPYEAGWRLRVLPSLGHVPVHGMTRRAVNRALHGWIADECGLSTVKNSLAVLVRVLEQAVRDGLLDANPARIVGWQREYQRAQHERTAPRSLALPGPAALDRLAAGLVRRSADGYEGWGDIVRFAAWTAARFSEVSALRAQDIDPVSWTWQVCRHTVSVPGGLSDCACRGRSRRAVPLRPAARILLAGRLRAARHSPQARLFTAPCGGRFSTPLLRQATDWDEAVVELGHEFLLRHDLRPTGLTWLAAAGVPLSVLHEVAERPAPDRLRRYLPPEERPVREAAPGVPPQRSGPRP
ncbi:integrase [Streptomyces sp. RS10V-4]|uniref:tyrosine-type recombinase/integrase n=1 Tax=Streptomyces rhizoryzae TaxID=2932493 RepID=UPI002003E8FC|nr:integrase [Streptomyces rhizoryzae]MCK7621746.1 integrase [Streptomyces rhizoryzae]